MNNITEGIKVSKNPLKAQATDACNKRNGDSLTDDGSAIPFGGYVGLIDDPKKTSKTLEQASYWEKICVFLAGPAANLLAAFVICVGIVHFNYNVNTTRVISTGIEQVQIGDEILAVNDQKIEKWRELELALVGKTTASLSVNRNNKVQQVQVNAVKTAQARQGLLFNLLSRFMNISQEKTTYKWDIKPEKVQMKLSFWSAIMVAYALIIQYVREFFLVLSMIVTQGVHVISGPIGIAKGLSGAMLNGLESVMWIVVRLSISLGMFNLLPFPGLDGGQVLLTTLRRFTGNRLSEKFMIIWGYAGLILLAFAMIYISVLDLLK